jgi:hypothetical protein
MQELICQRAHEGSLLVVCGSTVPTFCVLEVCIYHYCQI